MRTRIFRGRPSHRELLESSQRTSDWYAAAADKPRIESKLLAALPPKREIRRPVDKRPVGPSEHQVQAAVITWWHLQHGLYGLPVFALFAVPNGGARDAITGSLLKAEGVRTGALDLILAKPTAQYHGLFIEMKVGNNRPTIDQSATMDYLDNAGYKTSVHWTAESAITEIKEYLA